MNVNPKFFSHLVFAFQSWSRFILLCLSEGKNHGIFFSPIPCLFLYSFGVSPHAPRCLLCPLKVVLAAFVEVVLGRGRLRHRAPGLVESLSQGEREEGLRQGGEEALHGGMVDHSQGEGGVLASDPSS